jgi:hypothetical protein
LLFPVPMFQPFLDFFLAAIQVFMVYFFSRNASFCEDMICDENDYTRIKWAFRVFAFKRTKSLRLI